MASDLPRFPVITDRLSRRPSAVLGRISGLLADCSAVLVESSVRLAFWADFGARSGRSGALFGAVGPSKITLPPRREADFHIFVRTRSVHPSGGLLDPILGPLRAVLGLIWGLLRLSWALLGGRTSRSRVSKRLERAPWSCTGPWSGFVGPIGGLFEPSEAPFGCLSGPLEVYVRCLLGALRLHLPIHRARQNTLARTTAHADPHAVWIRSATDEGSMNE